MPFSAVTGKNLVLKKLIYSRSGGRPGDYGNSLDENNIWSRGGKDSIPAQVGAHLTNRDHLEAIHEHLRYIYDRLDDLLDRVHYLEARDQNRN